MKLVHFVLITFLITPLSFAASALLSAPENISLLFSKDFPELTSSKKAAFVHPFTPDEAAISRLLDHAKAIADCHARKETLNDQALSDCIHRAAYLLTRDLWTTQNLATTPPDRCWNQSE